MRKDFLNESGLREADASFFRSRLGQGTSFWAVDVYQQAETCVSGVYISPAAGGWKLVNNDRNSWTELGIFGCLGRPRELLHTALTFIGRPLMATWEYYSDPALASADLGLGSSAFGPSITDAWINADTGWYYCFDREKGCFTATVDRSGIETKNQEEVQDFLRVFYFE